MPRNHLADIQAGRIDKGNLIGIRKILNHHARLERGWPGNRINATRETRDAIEQAIAKYHPVACSGLTMSGLDILSSKRWYNRFQPHEHAIIDDLDVFKLERFDYIDCNAYPVWRAIDTAGNSFLFYNLPWQTVAYSRDPSLRSGPKVTE